MKTVSIDVYYGDNPINVLLAFLNIHPIEEVPDTVADIHLSEVPSLMKPYIASVRDPSDKSDYIYKAISKLRIYNRRYQKPYTDGYSIVNDIQYDIYFHKVI